MYFWSFFFQTYLRNKKLRETQNKQKETRVIMFQRSWILRKPKKPRENQKTKNNVQRLLAGPPSTRPLENWYFCFFLVFSRLFWFFWKKSLKIVFWIVFLVFLIFFNFSKNILTLCLPCFFKANIQNFTFVFCFAYLSHCATNMSNASERQYIFNPFDV